MVELISFNSGDEVQEGAVLLKLRAADDVARLESLKATAELNEITLGRTQRLAKTQVVSQAQLDADAANLKNAKAQVAQQQAIIEKKNLRAPFAGNLGIRAVDLAQYLEAGTPIVTLQALDPIYVDFYLPQQAVDQVQIGQKILAKVDAYEDQTFAGEISAINSKSFVLGAASASTQCVAREYDGGAADWYTFDREQTTPTPGSPAPAATSRRAFVTPATFRGMPARRFWEMEDAAVDIGSLTAAPEDVARLLLREFALIYGNDWFQIPLAVPVGSEIAVDALVVSDTFGLATVIPHYTDFDGPAGMWRMFALAAATPDAAQSSARLLAVTPGAVAPTDGAAIEDVLLLRDESANMAWGVERLAMGPAGAPVDRALAWKTTTPPAQPPAIGALPSYRLGSTVPSYWFPFVPVAVGTGPLRMRRGRLPVGDAAPMGRMLGYSGLTIFLEELPREGVHLERRYRAARGPDGSTHVWIGRRRSSGSGEGRSGLRFDYLE